MNIYYSNVQDEEKKFKLFNNFKVFITILTFLNNTQIEIKSDWKQEKKENIRNIDFKDIESIKELNSKEIK